MVHIKYIKILNINLYNGYIIHFKNFLKIASDNNQIHFYYLKSKLFDINNKMDLKFQLNFIKELKIQFWKKFHKWRLLINIK